MRKDLIWLKDKFNANGKAQKNPLYYHQKIGRPHGIDTFDIFHNVCHQDDPLVDNYRLHLFPNAYEA